MPTSSSESDFLRDELLREVARRYGLGSSIGVQALAGGYANDVFRLDGAGDPTVLHLRHPPVAVAAWSGSTGCSRG